MTWSCDRATAAPAEEALIEVADPEENTGFLICDAGTVTFRVLYADLRARGFFTGRSVVGAPLDGVFDLADDGRLVRRLQRAVTTGESATFFTSTRCRDGVSRDVHAHVQPLAAADGQSPWALCTFDALGAARSPSAPATDEAPAAEINAIVERLAERLSFLLPGRADVRVYSADDPLWVAAAADDVEEIVSSCLAVAMPFDPWRYTVKLAVEHSRAAGRVRLAFGLMGDRDGAMAEAALPGGVGEQVAALGLELERDRSLDGCRGLALVMPRAQGGRAVAGEEAAR